MELNRGDFGFDDYIPISAYSHSSALFLGIYRTTHRNAENLEEQ